VTELENHLKALMARKGSRVLNPKQIHQRLIAEHGEECCTLEQIEHLVEKLERDGEIVAVRGRHFSLLEFTPYVSGILRSRSDGSATINPAADRPGVFIHRKALRGGMNEDLVLVRVDQRTGKGGRDRGERIEGEVIRVLRREHSMVVGRFHALDHRPYIRPFDAKLDADIEIDLERGLEARDGEMVNVEILTYGGKNSNPTGRIVECLGMLGDPGVDIEVVLRRHHIPHEFSPEVLEQAGTIADEIQESEIARREDLRDRQIVTIDGETAKDFDDAVEVQTLANGNYRLGVHIADVSHYVAAGSPIDREAFERGTSVYFPGRAVPMLPEHLSNGVCSLNPRVDRLTFSVEIEIDPRGRFVGHRVFRSVIRTCERMTYTHVNAILTEDDPGLRERYAELVEHFRRMRDLFDILNRRRSARGSIDFDLPQSEVLLTEAGEIESILASERNIAHRIIEEFMLSANEVVARELIFASQPGIFRVHAPPDAKKMADLKEILSEFDLKFRGDPEEVRPADLQRLVRDAAGRPEERFITELVLRSMRRALYSEENKGHFALALEHYCHFTSPIRRYPDLVVHRRLGALIADGSMIGAPLDDAKRSDPEVARQASERERRAEEAEREVLEWKKVIFMREKVGETFTGRITGVMPFGLFVELDEYFLQGLVPIATIGGDYWAYLDREHRLRGDATRREFRLGDEVQVQVRVVDEDRRQIEFRLTEAGGEEVERRRGKYHGRK
jgi:ribonuclease R